MTDEAMNENELREQNEAVYARLLSLGYIREVIDFDKTGEMIEKNYEVLKWGDRIYHQVGDSSRRVVWRRWDLPQTLTAERYEEKSVGWREQERLTISAFIANEPPSAFTGNIPEIFRKVAAKLDCSEEDGSYFFKSPVAGAEEQILYAIKNSMNHRVRIIPGAPETAALLFECLPFGKKYLWWHLNRTTVEKYAEPDYRHDVAIESMPASHPAVGDPDYIRPVIRRLVRKIRQLTA